MIINVPCGACDGTGKDLESERCQACDGSGELTFDDQETAPHPDPGLPIDLVAGDLLFSLEIARKCMPDDVHPAHKIRLLLIERMVKRALENEPDYWRGALDDVEQLADEAVMRQRGNGIPPISNTDPEDD